MIDITFLGTSAMVPTIDRNPSAFLLRYNGEGILFDCGEATQRQLKIAKISPTVVTKILLSHWHGDHVLGLPGLVQTLGMSQYNNNLEVYGPVETSRRFRLIVDAFAFEVKVNAQVKDLTQGVFFQNDEFSLACAPLDHSVPCLGFSFIENDLRKVDIAKAKNMGIPQGPLLGKLQRNQEITFKGKKIAPEEVTFVRPGKKITFISDTSPCTNAVELAKDSDLLVCEATYTSKLEEKSEAYGHMTAQQAALLAQQANVKRLILTHFSQRYKTLNEIKEEAQTYFPNVECAYDFMKVKV